MVKISVIIPVYNEEDYLNECLDSIVNQSLEDIEIICVDDGSTDNSLNILKSYESDNRIKIIPKENSGLGASRNVALDIAQGEYIVFMDSDDYLNLNALEALYDLAESKSLDCIIYKIANFNNRTRKEFHTDYFDMRFLSDLVGDKVFDWSHVKDCLFQISVTSPSKLFKRQTIENIRFPEGLLFEDTLFFIKVLFNAQRMYFLDEYLYYRRIHSDSITNSYYAEFSDCITIYDMIYDYLKEIERYDEFKVQVFEKQCENIFHRYSQLPDEFKDDYFKKAKSSFSKIESELKTNGVLEMANERSLTIFSSVLNCDTYREFELTVEVFDLKSEIRLDTIRYQNQISRLAVQNNEYIRQIDDIKNSKSWKLTAPFRTIFDFFKKKI